MKPQSIFVISDLHLGGESGFQMCSLQGQALLRDFITWAAGQHSSSREVHLVLNGDTVDFLAEREFAAFTSDDHKATVKLQNIMNRTAPIWDALSKLLQTGARLTMLLGNHELELSLPGPRQLLWQRLGPGRLEFLYDNQALAIGNVLIEHGNRYDPWNITPHEVLREVRSCVSRREPLLQAYSLGNQPKIPEVPGSELVMKVMNPLKEKYGFIDLLKPENEGVLPLLVVLEPAYLNELGKIWELFQKIFPEWLKMFTNSCDMDRRPMDHGAVNAPDFEETWNEVCRLAGWDAGAAAALDTAQAVVNLIKAFCDIWEAARAQGNQGEQIDRLYHGLRRLITAHYLAFAINQECETYLIPATASAKRGFKAVVYGHTHLAKRVPITLPQESSSHTLPPNCVYLNTGTWADIMQLPKEILQLPAKVPQEAKAKAKWLEDENRAKASLTEFVAAMAKNQLGPWRKTIPTFVRIDLDGNETVSCADLFQFFGAQKITRVNDDQVLAQK